MVRKNSNTRRSADEGVPASAERISEQPETVTTESDSVPGDETPPARASRTKSSEEVAPGQVSLTDIRKAVAFANSVGGLEKAISLLQIVKVAKEVQ